METIYYKKIMQHIDLDVEIGESLGEKIRYYRAISRLTQKELANKVGVYFGTILRYENNIIKPSKKILAKLKDILGTNEL